MRDGRRGQAHHLAGARHAGPSGNTVPCRRCRAPPRRSHGRGIRRSPPSPRSAHRRVGCRSSGRIAATARAPIAAIGVPMTRAPPIVTATPPSAASAGERHQIAIAHELRDIGAGRPRSTVPPACRSAASGRRSSPGCDRPATAPPPGRASRRSSSSRAWCGCAESPRASPAAAWRPGWTAARPSAPAAAPPRWRARSPPVAAGRRTAGPGSLSACVSSRTSASA